MTFDADSFLKLCGELRKLGACKVEGFGFSATFVPQVTPSLPRGKQADLARSKPKSEPTTEELREAAYARELGAAG